MDDIYRPSEETMASKSDAENDDLVGMSKIRGEGWLRELETTVLLTVNGYIYPGH